VTGHDRLPERAQGCAQGPCLAVSAQPSSKVVDVTDTRQQLIDFIAAEAVFHGDFTLTSGKKASYYVDLRKVSLDHRVAPLIGQVMIDLIAEVPDVFAVGGMTMGADPVAAAVLTIPAGGASGSRGTGRQSSPRTSSFEGVHA
jgi:hypothetical protein